ncbi:MAG: hypothetical protein ACLP59_00750 [Bryobacteraceae bacterium]
MRIKIDSEDLDLYLLLLRRRYYRERKIPALEALFDAVKEMVGSEAGMVADAYAGCPKETEDWLSAEYLNISQTLEGLQQEISDIEWRVRKLDGRTPDELEAMLLDLDRGENEPL